MMPVQCGHLNEHFRSIILILLSLSLYGAGTGRPYHNGRGYETISLQGNDCSLVFDVTNTEQLNLQFMLGPSQNARCIFSFHTSRTGGRYRVGLQLSDVRLAPGVFQCELEGIGVYSFMDGGLFLMDDFCGSKQNSPILLTDSRSAILALRYGAGHLTQPTASNSTMFNLHVFTYVPQSTGYRPTYPYF